LPGSRSTSWVSLGVSSSTSGTLIVLDKGFGVGPLVWAPLSEMIGRRRAFNVSYPLFALFNMAGALAPNITTILITRFLAGTFGAAPLTNAGGQIGDMWAA